MTELLKRYRLNVEKCLQLAQTFQSLEAKRELILMANAWLALAVQREKNIEAAPANEAMPASEPLPPSGNEPPSVQLDAAEPDDPM